LWQRDRRLLVAELDAFLEADAAYRAEDGARTLATELAFGLAEATNPAVECALRDGRRIRLRGKADRIDQRADGSLVVIDYKTGRPDPYGQLGPEDPVNAGTHLQLPVYAYAARATYGASDTPVHAAYWFVGRGNNKRIGYPVDAGVDEGFEHVVRTIVDNIEAGVFVAVPPSPGPRGPFVVCAYCDPDGLGTTDRWREWERVYNAPELDTYRALIDPDAGVRS
jgi:hypothetical protein